MPSLPSTPRRVPSEHGSKSSILYLHSTIVRPKDTVRLSEDPLIQDSLTRGVAKPAGRTAHLHQQGIQDPREGPSLAGRTTRGFLRHGLVRLAREEAERSRRGTSRGAHDASHDNQGRQPGASRAPARAVSFFSLWCKGSKRRQEHQVKASISVQ